MENEPSTPTQSSPVEVNDVGGPGLFSAEKNARIEMESAMSERPRTDDSPTRQEMDLDQNEQQETNDGTTSDSSHTQRSGETTAPATTKNHQTQSSSAAQMMGPPPRPDFKATPTSAQPPQQPGTDQDQERATPFTDKTRGGASRIPTSSKPDKSTPRKTNGKRPRDEPHQQKEAPNDDAATETFNDPSNSLAAFDWMELEARYHQEMDDYLKQEHEIFRSFRELCQYFEIWAQTGQDHEVERSFKRIKTQSTLVRHHEEELEIKRQHYVKVVDAFKSALHLLGAGD